ncbi:4Fe-4S binding protein [Oscillatoria sp. CS-180]|uniref:4Fe-4S binding protein n=1 Tax=Oscillatoria sp. CS-180 TaxID=3021720 RepID=UPI00232E3D43|nr:4Fe-4S binding protein [Oscillatoria sp. CS-180]MDB9524658.1 4Fe-4S binding protein [Oscillatoria sp. CS-180]
MTRKSKVKRSQRIMIWLYPLIAIGGLFYPFLGYVMLAMMVFLVIYSYFKARYWCGNLCPRGAFLDIVMPYLTLDRSYPRLLTRKWFRWSVLGFFMSVFIARIMATGGNPVAIGGVFISMCVVTSLIAIPLGIATRPRAWCAFCPMGTLQETLGKVGRRHAKAHRKAVRLPSSSDRNSPKS